MSWKCETMYKQNTNFMHSWSYIVQFHSTFPCMNTKLLGCKVLVDPGSKYGSRVKPYSIYGQNSGRPPSDRTMYRTTGDRLRRRPHRQFCATPAVNSTQLSPKPYGRHGVQWPHDGASWAHVGERVQIWIVGFRGWLHGPLFGHLQWNCGDSENPLKSTNPKQIYC